MTLSAHAPVDRRSLRTRSAVRDARVALIGVSDRAVRAGDAEKALLGTKGDDEAVAAAAAAAARDLQPPSDLHGSSSYRRHVAERLARRALSGALESAAGAR